jgi:hypothetical protein
MPVHGTFREMVDRHRHLPADGAGPSVPACERRRHSRRWTAAKGRGLGPRLASPREQARRGSCSFTWREASSASAGLKAAPGRVQRSGPSLHSSRKPCPSERRRSWPGMLPSKPARLRARLRAAGFILPGPRVAYWAGSGAPRQAGDRARRELALSWCGQWRRAGGQIIRASRKRQRRKSPERTIGERRRGRGRGFAPCRAGSRAPAGRRQLRGRRGDQGHAIFPALPGSSAPGAGVAPLGARAV